jgi:pimeloyl-ACP methyl ester carboxylesterase
MNIGGYVLAICAASGRSAKAVGNADLLIGRKKTMSPEAAALPAVADAEIAVGVSNVFRTSDDVGLHYIEAGSGKPLIMLHGWSQSAALFKHQIAAFSAAYRVFAIDMRGHGESEKPDRGYNIHRMSQDVREFMVYHALQDTVLLGHSMGVKVIWGYCELHGSDRLSKLIMADDSPSLLDNPAWSDLDRRQVGPMFDAESLARLTVELTGPNGVALTKEYVGAMFTANYRARAPAELDWVVRENLKMPRDKAMALLLAIAPIDWRGVIRRITLPTLVMGGEASTHKTHVIAWEASQIEGARLKIWRADEGGSHFVFLENPRAFNAAVADFLAG